MLDALVKTRGGWLGAKRSAFLDAIHAALVEALCIPTNDKVLRLIEHPADCFAIPRRAASPHPHRDHGVRRSIALGQNAHSIRRSLAIWSRSASHRAT